MILCTLMYMYTFCMQFTEKEFHLRDPESHRSQCSRLSGPLSSEDSTTYGIVDNSPLNEIEHFHIANFQMPQDVMHILLEGVLPLETRLMMNVFLEEKLFTMEELNQRITYFSYGRIEAKSKPPRPFQRSNFEPTSSLHLSCRLPNSSYTLVTLIFIIL